MTQAVPITKNISFASGIMWNGQYYKHGGTFAGYMSNAAYNPETQVTVVAFINAGDQDNIFSNLREKIIQNVMNFTN